MPLQWFKALLKYFRGICIQVHYTDREIDTQTQVAGKLDRQVLRQTVKQIHRKTFGSAEKQADLDPWIRKQNPDPC